MSADGRYESPPITAMDGTRIVLIASPGDPITLRMTRPGAKKPEEFKVNATDLGKLMRRFGRALQARGMKLGDAFRSEPKTPSGED